jgi:5-methylcytosine-specific restriction endonuclease McrBC regulatory subunit McrC
MVESPELPLYADNFFARKIIPDIVMSRGQDVMVFDTKYKRMKMDGNSQNGMGDVDRMDFFQINTYMSYYQNHNYNLIAGGLLYPMGKFDEDKCYSGDWLGKNDSKFIIDGIDFSQLQGNDFAEIERDFVSRISKLIGRNHIQEQLWSASA